MFYVPARSIRQNKAETSNTAGLQGGDDQWELMLVTKKRAGHLVREVPIGNAVGFFVNAHTFRTRPKRVVRSKAGGQYAELVFQVADTRTPHGRDGVSRSGPRPKRQVIRQQSTGACNRVRTAVSPMSHVSKEIQPAGQVVLVSGPG
jgi:hypothetical protein